MDRKDFQRLEMYRRVVEFGAAHADLFPKETLAGKSFAALESALVKVSQHASSQMSSRSSVKAGAQARNVAEENLRSQLQRISDTAYGMAVDTPGLELKFPNSSRDRGQALIQVGRSFVSEATLLKKEFIQHQLPKDFIENLNTAIDEFEREIGNHAAWKTKRAHSTVGVQEGLASCATLLTRIDAIVGNAVSGNAPLAAEWEITRRLGRVRTRTAPAAPEGDKPQPQAA